MDNNSPLREDDSTRRSPIRGTPGPPAATRRSDGGGGDHQVSRQEDDYLGRQADETYDWETKQRPYAPPKRYHSEVCLVLSFFLFGIPMRFTLMTRG